MAGTSFQTKIVKKAHEMWDMSHEINDLESPIDFVLKFQGKNASKIGRDMRNYIYARLIDSNLQIEILEKEYGKKKVIYFQITASFDVVLRTASKLRLRKWRRLPPLDIDGFPDLKKIQEFVPFEYDFKDDYVGIENPETFFTSQERYSCVYDLIMSTRVPSESLAEAVILIGSITPACSLISVALKNKKISKLYTIHDEKKRESLAKKWALTLENYFSDYFRIQGEPLDSIRDYCGDKVSFFVAWVEAYIGALGILSIMTMLVQVVCLIFDWMGFDHFWSLRSILLILIVSLWAPLFVEISRRYLKGYAYKWGTLGVKHTKGPRPEFEGKLVRSKITGQPELHMPFRIRMYRLIIGWCVLAVLLMGQLASILKLASIEKNVVQTQPTWILLLYRISYALNIEIYRYVSSILHRWENHRTMFDWESNLIQRLFAFEFVSSFVPLYYFAFLERNFEKVQQLLISLVLLKQIVASLKESVIPYLSYRYQNYKKLVKLNEKSENFTLVEANASLPLFDECMVSDFMRMVVQFGFVVLFGSLYPWVPLIAFISNIVVLRATAWKICHAEGRPRGLLEDGIGQWHGILRFLCILAVATNAGLLAILVPDTVVNRWIGHFVEELWNIKIPPLMYFVFVEHLLLVATLTIFVVIAARTPPGWVKKDKARRENLLQIARSSLLHSSLSHKHKHKHKHSHGKEKEREREKEEHGKEKEEHGKEKEKEKEKEEHGKEKEKKEKKHKHQHHKKD